MKRFIGIIIMVLLAGVVNGYVLRGNSVFYDSLYANLTITPATTYNPSRIPQEYVVNVKDFAGDLCMAFAFPEQLQDARIELWENYSHPYTYCYSDDDCETRYYKYPDWKNYNSYFSMAQIGDEYVYYHAQPKYLQAHEQLRFRLYYDVVSPDGKWNAYAWSPKPGYDCVQSYQQEQYYFFYTIDPWWNTADQNVTDGMPFLTNISFSDRFEDYSYYLIEPFETLSQFALLYDGINLATTTTATEQTYAEQFVADPPTSASDFTQLYNPNDLAIPYNLSGMDKVAMWVYINDTSNLNCSVAYPFFMTLYSNWGSNYRAQYYSSCSEIQNGWNRFVWELDNPDLNNNFDKENITRLLFSIRYTPTQQKRIQLRLDHLHAYNSSNYFNTSNWDIATTGQPGEGIELQKHLNEFGFNTTGLAVVRDTSNNAWANRSLYGYENFFMEFKANSAKDYGNDQMWWILYRSTGDYIYFLRYRSTYIYVYDSLSGQLSAIPDGQASGTWRYYKIQRQDGNLSFWYRNATGQTTWRMALNLTDNSAFANSAIRTLASSNIVDQYIQRELIPTQAPIGKYHASFIYASSNNSNYSTVSIEPFKNDTNQGSTTYSVTDFNQSINYSLDTGKWQFNVSVCDIYGNCAWNLTQAVYINYGGLNIAVYDEGNESLLDFVTVNFILDQDNAANIENSTTTGTFYFSNIPAGSYRVNVRATGYQERDYFVTVDSQSVAGLLAVLLLTNDGINVTFSAKDFDSGQFVEDATFNLQKKVGGNYVTVAQGMTDFVGSVRFLMDPDVSYNIPISQATYYPREINVKPTDTAFTVLLTQNVTVEFANLYNDIFYNYYPRTALVSPINNFNFTFTTVSLNGTISWFSMGTDFNGSVTINNSGSPSGGTLIMPRNLSAYRGENVGIQYCIYSSFGLYCFNNSYIINPVSVGNLTLPALVNDSRSTIAFFASENRGKLILGIVSLLGVLLLMVIAAKLGLEGHYVAGIGMVLLLIVALLGLFDLLIAIILNFVYFTGALLLRREE